MEPEIIDITGIGPAAAATLDEHGITNLADLANASVEEITTVPGFSEARAVRVLAAATELLAASGITPSAEEKKSGKKDKAAGKDKKDKKGKKDKKKKDKGKDKKKDKGKKKGKK